MADLIRYDLLVQDALRGAVRHVLSEVAKNGLQGEHHFFITFKTATPGLRLSNRMRERYPDEMTIILQHQFWGLSVTDSGFEVGLSFHNTPERLFVPFAAITMFQDPSVNFGLKFDVRETSSAVAGFGPPSFDDVSKPVPPSRGLTPAVPAKIDPGRATADQTPSVAEVKGGDAKSVDPKKSGDRPKPVLAKVGEASPQSEAGDKDDTKVISIDAFRKKP